jgi:N6-L-threonylcarbamoyladenine synthase
VAASPPLRAAAAELCAEAGVRLSLPPLRWSTDNGAMIALATWDYLAAGEDLPPLATTSLSIESC